MDKKQMKVSPLLIKGIVYYCLFSILFYLIAYDQLNQKQVFSTMPSPSFVVGEITTDTHIEQALSVESGVLNSISFIFGTYGRNNEGTLNINIYVDETKAFEDTISTVSLKDNEKYTIALVDPIVINGQERISLEITSNDSIPGNAVTIWCGNSVEAGRASSRLDNILNTSINDNVLNGQICYQTEVVQKLMFGKFYWPFIMMVGVITFGYYYHSIQRFYQGKSNVAIKLVNAFRRYRFLAEQLIERDFKTKYKRSVLGVLWSFLNPLLIMLVQYMVFSTLFKSDIDNFPLYLLTGIICFNFFNEATNMALTSIVGNASLITKVYVPKYIYPISRVISSAINLLISMIPIFVVMMITKTPLRPALLLLPIGLVFLVSFSLGIGFILSSIMVFFRDTQFLWGVLSLLWMYITPIFYPETIIPQKFIFFYRLNPLYHIINFIRSILISGVSPEPKAYLICFVLALLSLSTGAYIFKRTQDKFILNI